MVYSITSKMTLFTALQNFCQQQASGAKIWLGFSGGSDSHVVLKLLSELCPQFSLSLGAIHINHGLSIQADAWEAHCRQVCADLSVPFCSEKVYLKKIAGESLEAFARDKRYEVFSKFVSTNDVLVTAHHLDDQAETFLLQLSRGAGIKGLSAMPRIKKFAQGWHVRPCLQIKKEAMLAYAQQHQLGWIEDDSNTNCHFTRNFLRHEVLPILQQRWPNIANTLSRVSQQMSSAQTALDYFATKEIKNICGSQPNTLSVQKLLSLSFDVQVACLRCWIMQQHVPLPPASKFQKIFDNVLTANSDRNPILSWDKVELRRFRDDLFILEKCVKCHHNKIYAWDLKDGLKLDGGIELSAQRVLGGGFTSLDHVSIGFRQGGEVCQLHPPHHQTLKNIFQALGVPSWEREHIPLIYYQDKLIGAVGLFIIDEFKAKESEWGIEITKTK